MTSRLRHLLCLFLARWVEHRHETLSSSSANEDEALSNVTLEHKLRADLRMNIPDFLLDASPEAYLRSVTEAVAGKLTWHVTNDVFLGTFQYSKMAMWEDLQELKNADEISHPLVRFLAGDSAVKQNQDLTGNEWFLKREGELAGGRLDDYVSPQDMPLVMAADFSQLQAIGAARTGQNLVIHGPPGTGKSQTIANLIGTFIADGKTVLFVSEKTAALDVVKRRLGDRGLGVFCLDLHSERAKKVNVYAQFGESLAHDRVVRAVSTDYRRLLELRSRLNTFVRELHARRLPLGYSSFQVMGSFALCRDYPDVDFSVPDPRAFTQEVLSAFTDLASRLASREREFAEHFTGKWLALRIGTPSVGLPADIRRRLGILTASVEGVVKEGAEVAGWTGLTPPNDMASLASLIRTLELLGECPQIERAWLNSSALNNLFVLAEEQERRQRNRLNLLQGFGAHFRGLPSSIEDFSVFAQYAEEAFQASTSSERWLGADWPRRVLSAHTDIRNALEELPSSVERCLTISRNLSLRLGLETDDLRATARSHLEICDSLVSLATVPEAWLSPDELRDTIIPRLEQAATVRNELNASEARLLSTFELEISQDVQREMLLRFRLDYGSGLKRLLSGQYKRDVRTIRSHQTTNQKVKHSQILQAVEDTVRHQQLGDQWQNVQPDLKASLGWRYGDRDTNFEACLEAAATFAQLLEVLNPLGPAREAMLDANILRNVRVMASELRDQLKQLASLEERVSPQSAEERARIGGDGSLQEFLPASRDLLSSFERLEHVLQGLIPFCLLFPNNWLAWKEAIQAGKSVLVMDAAIEAETVFLQTAFGRRFDSWETDWSEIKVALEWTAQLVELIPQESMSGGIITHLMAPRPQSEYEARQLLMMEAHQTLEESQRSVEVLLDPEKTVWRSWNLATFSDLNSWSADLTTSADSANDWLDYRTLVMQFDGLTSPGTVDQIRRATSQVSQVVPIVQRRLLESWLDALNRDIAVLGRFAGLDHDSVIQHFKALDQSLPAAAIAEIQRCAFAAYPTRLAMTNAGELGVLRGQLSRRRGQLAVRRLVQRIPVLAKQLKPCFMMSPLAVSQFLPRSLDVPFFDVVIFDEASQVFPEDAVPAISRAGQAIVVGDVKQLPPTSFFRRLGDDVEETTEEEDDAQEEDALQGRDSILEAMLGRALGTVAIESHLNVHYRSRHEDLIRFSNASFYDSRLHVYPSAVRQSESLGLRDEFVDEAVYQDRRNVREAERVVDLVFNLMRTRPGDESIGVVALSRTQAELIQDLLNNRRLLETDVEARFSESSTEPFFAKNLENVQGDERDHIILCIGYGPNAAGQVFQRFGPINSDLGWRRLNVAVSRARRSLSVVHSIRPERILGTTAGARCLKSFLEFAKDPETWSAGVSGSPLDDGDPDSDFEAAVFAALSARGHNVRRQVGAAGYRVDLAILASDSSRFELGIECDGAAYHSGPAARDRDWLRQSILESLGWCIHRVWSTDWLRNPGREVDAIEAALSKCRSGESISSAPNFITRAPESGSPELDLNGVDSVFAEDLNDPLFEEYEPADLAGSRHGPELRYETETVLGELISRIVTAEGPVHQEQVVSRLRSLYGMDRAGEPTRAHVMDVLRRLAARRLLSLDGDFLFLPTRPIEPRRPAPSLRRPIEQIAIKELAEGIRAVSSLIQGASRDELITETARQFGFERTGPEIQAALRVALEAMITREELRVDEEGLIRPARRSDVVLFPPATDMSSADQSSLSRARILALQRGYEVIDKTQSHGAFWIIGGEELETELEPLGFSFAPNGGRATLNRPAWYAK